MASEQEIQRMVIRLMGDSSNYRAVLDQAVKESIAAFKKLEKESKEDKALQARMKEQNRLMAEGAAVTRSLLPPTKVYQQELARLTSLLGAGAITYDTYTQAAKRAKATMEAASPAAQGLGANLSRLGAGLATAGAVMGGIFGGSALGGLMSAGKFEQTTIAFETMIGSVQETKKLLAELTDFAAKTPFEMPEIEQAARGLVQFGERGNELMETLKILGNAAAGTSTDFGMVALIFNQIRGVGRLLTQDFRQLSTRGILSLTDIAKHFGVTTQEADKMISAGKVGFEDVRAILKSLSAEGGRFANLMERQSHSLLGLWSTFKDAIGLVAREFGTVLAPAAKAVVTQLIALAEWFRNLPPAIKTTIAVILGAGTALSMVMVSMGGFMIVAGQVVTAIAAYKAITIGSTFATVALGTASKVASVGMRTLAAAAIYYATRALAQALAGTEQLNNELLRSGNLAMRLNQGTQKGRQDTLQKAEGMEGADKKNFIAQQLAQAKKEAEGSAQAVKNAQKEVDRLNTTYNSFAGAFITTELDAANQSLKEHQERSAMASEFVGDLTREMKGLKEAEMHANEATVESIKKADEYINAVGREIEVIKSGEDAVKIMEMQNMLIDEKTISMMQAMQAEKEYYEKERSAVKDSIGAMEEAEAAVANFGKTASQIQLDKMFDIKAAGAEGFGQAEIDRYMSATTELEKLTAAKKKNDEQTARAKALTEQFMSPQEKYNQKVKELKTLLDVVGPSFKRTFDKGIKEAEKELQNAKLDVDATVNMRVEGNEAVRRGSAEFKEIVARMQGAAQSASGFKVPGVGPITDVAKDAGKKGRPAFRDTQLASFDRDLAHSANWVTESTDPKMRMQANQLIAQDDSQQRRAKEAQRMVGARGTRDDRRQLAMSTLEGNRKARDEQVAAKANLPDDSKVLSALERIAEAVEKQPSVEIQDADLG